MSSKFDEYLSKGGVTEQDKQTFTELNKTAESIESTPTAPTPVPDNTKADSTPGKLDGATAERIESTQQGMGNNHEATGKDSLSAYDNSKQSQQPSLPQKENESEIDR